MTIAYSSQAIDARLTAIANTIDGGGSPGSLVLLAGGAVVSTVQLARPCGIVNGGVLTFSTSSILMDPSAAVTGDITTGRIQDSSSAVVVSGLSVGIPGSTSQVIIANGQSSTRIEAGQMVQLLAAEISGSLNERKRTSPCAALADAILPKLPLKTAAPVYPQADLSPLLLLLMVRLTDSADDDGIATASIPPRSCISSTAPRPLPTSTPMTLSRSCRAGTDASVSRVPCQMMKMIPYRSERGASASARAHRFSNRHQGDPGLAAGCPAQSMHFSSFCEIAHNRFVSSYFKM